MIYLKIDGNQEIFEVRALPLQPVRTSRFALPGAALRAAPRGRLFSRTSEHRPVRGIAVGRFNIHMPLISTRNDADDSSCATLHACLRQEPGKIVMPCCSRCSLDRFCVPEGMSREEISILDIEIHERIRIRKGQTLYRQGDPLTSVYAIRSGMLKTLTSSADGRVHITGFHIQGDLVGLDSFDEVRYASDAIALEDSDVCVIHVENLAMLAIRAPFLQQQLLRMTSREVRKDHVMLLSLGSMSAGERVATFLVNLSERFAARGYSSSEFYLRMTREDIGNHLGIKLETVSRLLSKMMDRGLIQVRHRHVKLLNVAELKARTHLSEQWDSRASGVPSADDCAN
ncbi:helix-turn-helix domain-containing protein [Caballeronia pedi]